jgi:hypothetical protein
MRAIISNPRNLYDGIAPHHWAVLGPGGPNAFLDETERDHSLQHQSYAQLCRPRSAVRDSRANGRQAGYNFGRCPSEHESPELLDARATLYYWLQSRFGSAVRVEHHVEGAWPPWPRGHGVGGVERRQEGWRDVTPSLVTSLRRAERMATQTARRDALADAFCYKQGRHRLRHVDC